MSTSCYNKCIVERLYCRRRTDRSTVFVIWRQCAPRSLRLPSNGILISSAIYAPLTRVPNTHAHGQSNTTGHIYAVHATRLTICTQEWSTLAVVLLVAMSTEFCWCRCRYLFRSVPSVFVMGIRRHYVTGYCGVCNCILVRQCVVILWVMLTVWMNQQLVISSDVSSIWSSLHVLNYASTCALQQPYTASTQSCRRLLKI